MKKSIDSSAIFSIVIGVLSFIAPIPAVLPVIGLALGLNTIMKEQKLSKRQPSQLYMGIAGCILCGLATLFIILIRHSAKWNIKLIKTAIDSLEDLNLIPDNGGSGKNVIDFLV